MPVLLIGAVAVGAGMIAALAWRTHERRGEAIAVASIQVAPKAPVAEQVVPVAPAVAAVAEPSPAPGSTIEMQNGVKVVRFNPAVAAQSISIPVEDGSRVPLKPSPDPRVSEASQWGPLPRRAANGLRPADVYARPALAVTGPVVALLLDGMGTDQLATADAARRLSPVISFAFPTVVADAPAQVAEARRAGHEVFMTVGVGAGPLEALHAQMAQYTGYVGVLLESAWFSSAPAVEDLARRGLLLLGQVNSQALEGLGPGIDLRVDAGAGQAGLLAAFDRLATLARDKGSATLVISHGPMATEAVAAFTARLAASGIAVVPISAMAGRSTARAKAAN